MGCFYDRQRGALFAFNPRQSRALSGRRLFLSSTGRSAIPVVQSWAIYSGVYNAIICPPLSALRSEDEDIFGATILILPANRCAFASNYSESFEIYLYLWQYVMPHH